jgi:2-desacetyl-2-hydroxyethyl bacteriochlorophyllide A dehydrogenase
VKTLSVCIVEPYRAELDAGEVSERLGPQQVLVRTEHSGVSSGTELAVFTGIHQWLEDPRYPRWRFPFAAGYSACGIVEAVGAEVAALRPGERVAYAGQHASWCVVSERGCWPVSSGVASSAAAFACIARYGFGAAARVSTTLGRRVFVLGLGVIGQFAVRAFLAGGAHPVIGLDVYENRRAVAVAGGATASLDPHAPYFGERVLTVAGAPQADIVADATGAPSALPEAMSLTRDGGQCVVVGSPRGLAEGVNFYPDLHKRCIEVMGAHGDFLSWPLGERLGWDVDKAMRWLLAQMATGRLSTAGMPTESVAPAEAQKVYERLLKKKDTIVCAAFDWSRV